MPEQSRDLVCGSAGSDQSGRARLRCVAYANHNGYWVSFAPIAERGIQWCMWVESSKQIGLGRAKTRSSQKPDVMAPADRVLTVCEVRSLVGRGGSIAL